MPPTNIITIASAMMMIDADRCGSSISRHDDADRDDHERHDTVAERLHLLFIGADHAGEKQHDRDLCNLRRLKRRKAEAQPPARTVDASADVRDPDDGKQEDAHAQHQQRQTAVGRHAHFGQQDHGHNAGHGKGRLAHEVIRRRLALRIRASEARREYHDDADRQQQQREHEKRRVKLPLLQRTLSPGAREISDRKYSYNLPPLHRGAVSRRSGGTRR